jgi:hypothetical protein
MPDTEKLDLSSDEICINGFPARGFTFLKTFTGGVEFYGLKNWGMPVLREGKLLPIHGETSNIPVGSVSFFIENNGKCTLQAEFIYRSFEDERNLPWYEKGEKIYTVTRKLILFRNTPEFWIEDVIENISKTVQLPDWGYHITLMPENFVRCLVPSKLFHEREFDVVPEHFETWQKADDENVRKETGIVHKKLLLSKIDKENSETTILFVYPENHGIAVSIPEVPYFQTWFCSGGKNSKEFTFKNGESISQKNWDGIGIEIGSSPLDNNGVIDEYINYSPQLKPGESKKIRIKFNRIEQPELLNQIIRINEYNKTREVLS